MDTREIDARVAREVMGINKDKSWIAQAWALPCKHYSTDMNAAMEVAGRMRERGYNLTICSSPVDAPNITWSVQYGRKGMNPPYNYVDADTPAMAICLAALDAASTK